MNRYLKCISFCVLLMLSSGVVINASTPNQNKNMDFILDWLKERKECLAFLSNNQTLLPDQDIEVAECYIQAVTQFGVDLGDNINKKDDLVNYIADRVMHFEIRDELLSKMVEQTANVAADYIDIIKQLVNRGASTKNVLADNINQHNYSSCETTEFIIENNKGFNKKDILSMTWEGGNKIVCVKAVEKFLTYNPESINLTNDEGDTALHLLLSDIAENTHTKLALKLMSKANVNVQNNRGNTALHTLIIYNHRYGANELNLFQEVFDKFVELGGDLDLKNNDGVSIRDLLKKYALFQENKSE